MWAWAPPPFLLSSNRLADSVWARKTSVLQFQQRYFDLGGKTAKCGKEMEKNSQYARNFAYCVNFQQRPNQISSVNKISNLNNSRKCERCDDSPLAYTFSETTTTKSHCWLDSHGKLRSFWMTANFACGPQNWNIVYFHMHQVIQLYAQSAEFRCAYDWNDGDLTK